MESFPLLPLSWDLFLIADSKLSSWGWRLGKKTLLSQPVSSLSYASSFLGDFEDMEKPCRPQ